MGCNVCLDVDADYRVGENPWLPVVLEFAGENLDMAAGVKIV